MDIIPNAPVQIWGLPFEGFNVATLYNSWLVMAILITLALLVARRLERAPGRLQVIFEMVTEFFEDLCDSTLGKEHGRKYLPFIITLFLFVLFSNVIGTIPNVLAALGWPGFYCPTQDLNTPLGLALIVFFVVHISAIRVKGFREWLWSFFEPSFPGDRPITKGVGVVFLVLGAWLNYLLISGYARSFAQASVARKVGGGLAAGLLAALSVMVLLFALQRGRVPNVVMAPLNVVGELGKSISHPFRLFGNIFGGFVILTVVSHLILYIGIPLILIPFFGFFIGLVQAFVFAMLALAYTAVQIRE
ncbi:MAG: F0F1 ATP synthase subunit A [Planctomycetes bacterium]|nr:F0F1 ATP synthase subunit A [Planctomycetota bacterium]